MQFIHTIVRVFQCIFLIQDVKCNGRPIDGNAVVYIRFFILILASQAFNVSISLLREKYFEHVNISNTFLSIPTVKSSLLIKFMYFNSPILAIIVTIIYSLGNILYNFDPITLYISIALKEWPKFQILVKIVMVLFDTFSMIIAVYTGFISRYVLLVYCTLQTNQNA